MKIIYLLMFTLLLASCGNSGSTENESIVVDESAMEETTNQINEEIDSLNTETDSDGIALTESNSNNGEVVKLDAKYNNPKGEVDMSISYTLSESGTIETIEVTATTYDLEDFNTAAQDLVGKTLEDAKNFEKAGASLTNEAFKNAIK
ncbi:MAG: hypothetical protein Q8K30_01415 [Candidatus Gracilibacteria bacterium]|nr:hypothetical protein [Candidatus Gracilibacteria bacterium]